VKDSAIALAKMLLKLHDCRIFAVNADAKFPALVAKEVARLNGVDENEIQHIERVEINIKDAAAMECFCAKVFTK
jgi:hypothetical protein